MKKPKSSKFTSTTWKKIFLTTFCIVIPATASAMQPGACGIQERPSGSDCSYTPGPGNSSSAQDAARILQAVGAELKRQEAQRTQQQEQKVGLDEDKAERYRRRANKDVESARKLDLSGDCNLAQQKGAAYANSLEGLEKYGVCEAGLKAKLIGIVTVRVAESCQGKPSAQQLLSQGQKLTEEGEQTMSQSCSWY